MTKGLSCEEGHDQSKSVTRSALSLTEESLEPSGVVLTVGGELDIATATELRMRLNAAVDAALSGAR